VATFTGLGGYFTGLPGYFAPDFAYLRRKGPERWIMRKLQRFVVNIPLRLFEMLCREEYIEEVHGYWVQKCDGLYKPGIGLLSDSTKWNNELFIA